MKTTRKVTCPNCGRDVESPLTLITAKQIQMLPEIQDSIPTDSCLYQHITNFGGVLPNENELKQVTYEGDPPKGTPEVHPRGYDPVSHWNWKNKPVGVSALPQQHHPSVS